MIHQNIGVVVRTLTACGLWLGRVTNSVSTPQKLFCPPSAGAHGYCNPCIENLERLGIRQFEFRFGNQFPERWSGYLLTVRSPRWHCCQSSHIAQPLIPRGVIAWRAQPQSESKIGECHISAFAGQHGRYQVQGGVGGMPSAKVESRCLGASQPEAVGFKSLWSFQVSSPPRGVGRFRRSPQGDRAEVVTAARGDCPTGGCHLANRVVQGVSHRISGDIPRMTIQGKGGYRQEFQSQIRGQNHGAKPMPRNPSNLRLNRTEKPSQGVSGVIGSRRGVEAS